MRSTSLRDKTGSKKVGTETIAAENSAKKRSPWMWAGVGVAALLCLAIAFFAIRNNRHAPRAVLPTETTILAPATQTLPATPLPPPGNGGSGENPVPPAIQNASPEITMAMELVAKNPNDPDAHLDLSIALMDAKEFRPAMDELAQALNLAGPNNKDFLKKAAEKFTARESWVAAANAYLRLIQTYRKDAPKEIENNFHESVYKAAEQKDMPLFVAFERIDNVNPPLGFIARGRYALYQGRLEDAKTQLDNAQKAKPDMYEVYLLKAEIEMKTGNQAEAKNILLPLSTATEAPKWISLMAENYLKTIQ
jgi:tetratricopeptide (TPR) repeat protein